MVNKTKMKKKEEVVHEWFIMDASDKVLGRAATRIATLIKGKHRPDFTPHVDSGAGVIVLNCDKIRVTGKKSEQKFYTSYSGYPSGLKKVRYDKMHVKNPKYILRNAVKGMLPHNKLGDRMIRRLKLYTGDKHPHSAQNPQEIKL